MYKEVVYKMSTYGKYNRVGTKKGALVISGALKKMELDKTFIYVPMFKVAGPEKEVSEWLNKYHKDDTNTALKTSYTVNSLKKKNIRETFENEVKKAEELRQQVCQSRADMKSVNLLILSELVKIYDKNKKSLYDNAIVTFKDKIIAIKNENKCLDITNLTNKGLDGKKVTVSSTSSKKRLSQLSNELFYNVVYENTDENHLQGIRNFLSLYGSFKEEQIEEIIEKLQNPDNIVNITTQRSPLRTPLSHTRPRVVNSPPNTIWSSEDEDEIDTDDE